MAAKTDMTERQQKTALKALYDLIDYFPRHGDLADAAKVTGAAVSKWKERGYVPSDKAKALSKLTGGKITKERLRPDYYA